MVDAPSSGTSTPSENRRFVSQAHTVEDRLKADTVGLVTLNDFRKRRAEAVENSSGAATPNGRDSASKATAVKKRKKAHLKKGGALSFADVEQEDDRDSVGPTGTKNFSHSNTPVSAPLEAEAEAEAEAEGDAQYDARSSTTVAKKKPLRPNTAVPLQPKALTKLNLMKEAELKEALKKEYTQIQEAVKATEFVLPFVFFDGKNVPGGRVRLTKGHHIWMFLERARKVGAVLGRGHRGRKDWARISVDDLMFVRADLIIPHHYTFHYFLINKSLGYHGPLFSNSFSADPTSATPKDLLPTNDASKGTTTSTEEGDHLLTAAQRKEKTAQQTAIPDSELEGFDEDPTLTKVVDRRWYVRNRHIYPASSWERYDPAKEEDYQRGMKKDSKGNAMFFSR